MSLRDFIKEIGAELKFDLNYKNYLFCQKCKKYFIEKNCSHNVENKHEDIPNDLFEIFIFKNFLGKGGEAKVFEVEHKGETFALKIKKDEDFYLEDNEIKSLEHLKRLNHENIVKYFESEMAIIKKIKFVVILLELCDNSLTKILNPSISRNEFLNYLLQICNGIKALQYPGENIKPIIHQDLKPSNILIKDSILKISDFGISKIRRQNDIDEDSEISNVRGTRIYMAPEKNEFTISCKTDIYSLGIIIEKMKDKITLKDRKIDQIVKGIYLNINEFFIFFFLDCKKEIPKERPDINTIIERLKICRSGEDSKHQTDKN